MSIIRSATPSDADTILRLAVDTGLFQPDELGDVSAMLNQYASGDAEPGHTWLVYDDGAVSGVAYYAPEPFGPDVWNLYMLAVDPAAQGSGQGSALVRRVESDIAPLGARVLIIETSSEDQYERTRAFYTKLGYAEEARIRDYYAPGDDKVVFWKAIAPALSPA